MATFNYNKVCEYEDFADPDLASTIRDVFPHEMKQFSPEFPRGAEYRKYWEIGMSIRALRDLGALRRDATILGVGTGTEATVFYLTNQARQVFATDLYLSPGAWYESAPAAMLAAPEMFAPYEFERSRLVVQHMDGRCLSYPDDTFDGIFSSGSIEHFGSSEFIANAAYEMGRVLKPGGVLTLSTEYLIEGPPGSDGWEHLRLFSAAALMRLIVEASGLELADEFRADVSAQTLATARDEIFYSPDVIASLIKQGRHPRVGEIVWSKYPHLVLMRQGHVYTSVHLALQKTGKYPATPNAWAKPSDATRRAVAHTQAKAVSMLDYDWIRRRAARRVLALRVHGGRMLRALRLR